LNTIKTTIKKKILPNYEFYLFLLPALIYLAIFIYWPMFGIQIAFRDYVPSLGITESPWVGLKHFDRFFSSYLFWDLLKNTLYLSFYQLVAGFPFAIVLAVCLHYCFAKNMKSFIQTVSYAPYFISQVVMVGILLIFFSPHNGVVNAIIGMFGGEPVNFMSEPKMFRSLYVWSGVWQNTGFQSIIYLAVLTGVNPELHEAAIVDGASKIKRLIHIDIPFLIPTIVIILILNLGSIMSLGFEKAYLMQNNSNAMTSEIISTYIYKIGILEAQYSYTTAVGLFNNLVNLVLLVVVNNASKRISGNSLF